LLLLYCIDSAAEYVWGVHAISRNGPCHVVLHIGRSIAPKRRRPTELRNVVAMPVQCPLLQSSSLLAFLMCGLRGMGSPRRFDQLVLHSAQPERGAGFLRKSR
jgi:hypothetical protein